MCVCVCEREREREHARERARVRERVRNGLRPEVVAMDFLWDRARLQVTIFTTASSFPAMAFELGCSSALGWLLCGR